MEFFGNNENILYSPVYEFSNHEDFFSEKEFEYQGIKNDYRNENSQNFISNFQMTFNEEKEFSFVKNDEMDDNFDINTFLNKELPKQALVENNLTNLGKTKATSLLGTKVKRSKEKTSKEKTSEEIKTENSKKKNCGRKNKDSQDKGEHNKYSEDNIMRKIKSYFFSYLHENLNDKFNNKKYQFLKLNPLISENLKKDFNEELMKKTIKELYMNSPISGKFRKQKKENPYYNKKIIEIIENQSNNEEKE